MYTCSQCKTIWPDEPVRKIGPDHINAVCPHCVVDNDTKSRERARERNDAIAARNQCVWCDDQLTDQNRAKPTKEEHRSNICINCCHFSIARQQLNKWVVAIGPNPDKPLLNNKFWTYINGSEKNTTRQILWEQERGEKLAARRTKSAKQAGLMIDQIRHNQQLDNLFSKLDPGKLEKLLQLVEMLEDKE